MSAELGYCSVAKRLDFRTRSSCQGGNDAKSEQSTELMGLAKVSTSFGNFLTCNWNGGNFLGYFPQAMWTAGGQLGDLDRSCASLVR